MVTEQTVFDAVQECNKDRSKSFAEFIATVFKDKFIELYLGDTYEDVSTEQVSTSCPAVFCGKVVTAYKECLVLNAIYVAEGTNTPQLGNLVFLSERAIRGLNEIDGNGLMEDMFLKSKEALTIKALFIDGKTLPAKK